VLSIDQLLQGIPTGFEKLGKGSFVESSWKKLENGVVLGF